MGVQQTLKALDENLKFVFLTGVTKFSKVSIFSDLNQLNDISISENYANICGITEDEMLSTFEPEIKTMAEKKYGHFQKRGCPDGEKALE